MTKFTDDYDIMTLTNCTDDENSIDITMPTLILTKPCCISSLYLKSLMSLLSLMSIHINETFKK